MDWQLFIIFLSACAAASATGSLFPPDKWYFEEIKKPVWTPPPWLFPLAWVTLYVSSAYAAMRVGLVEGSAMALAFWALQIALNTLWTPVFFGLKRLRAAFIVLVCLWLAVLGTMLTFFEVDRTAGWLIAPYLFWVTYAGALNLWIWLVNGEPEAAKAS